MEQPGRCPLCLPRPDDSAQWLLVARLGVSTLYLDRNQTYRGHCQLVHDTTHAEGIELLAADEHARLMADLHRAARAIAQACRPDRMNYMSLNNVVPHLHWHLVPRYRGDPRWGMPIHTTNPAEMPVTRIAEPELQALAQALRRSLSDAQTS